MFSMMPLRVLALLACAICDLSSAQVQWEMLGLPPGLSPRSVEFAPQELQLQNRQAGTCGADEHSCTTHSLSSLPKLLLTNPQASTSTRPLFAVPTTLTAS